MQDYITIIAGNVTVIKTGDVWTRNGVTVANPWDVVQEVVMHHDYFDVFAIRDNGTVDCIEYYAGYRHHTTFGVNR